MPVTQVVHMLSDPEHKLTTDEAVTTFVSTYESVKQSFKLDKDRPSRKSIEIIARMAALASAFKLDRTCRLQLREVIAAGESINRYLQTATESDATHGVKDRILASSELPNDGELHKG